MFSQEDPQLTARLHELIEQAFQGRPVVSAAFYPPNIWLRLQANPAALPEGSGFDDFMDSDRRLFASPLSLARDHIRLLEVTNLYPQRGLTHSDYLGALMNLGIRREKFSDLFVVEDKCFIPMTAELLPYILEHLHKVGNNGVALREANPAELKGFRRQVEELTILAASLRLDVLVSELTHLSRSKAEELIRSGRVQLNYLETTDRSQTLKAEDILTIRGYGKYRMGDVQGESRKGRLRLGVEKYR